MVLGLSGLFFFLLQLKFIGWWVRGGSRVVMVCSWSFVVYCFVVGTLLYVFFVFL